jgi:hypothetical protein
MIDRNNQKNLGNFFKMKFDYTNALSSFWMIKVAMVINLTSHIFP